MNPRTITAAAAGGLLTMLLLTGCSSPTVTRWSWTPPGVQTVTSCSVESSGTCLAWSSAQVPSPQICTLTLSNAARVKVDVTEPQCRAYLGQHYPPSGSTS